MPSELEAKGAAVVIGTAKCCKLGPPKYPKLGAVAAGAAATGSAYHYEGSSAAKMAEVQPCKRPKASFGI